MCWAVLEQAPEATPPIRRSWLAVDSPSGSSCADATSTGSISYMSEIYARQRTNFPEIFTISTKKYQILFKIVHFLQKVKYF